MYNVHNRMYNNKLYILLDVKCTFLDHSSFRFSKIIQTSPPNIPRLPGPNFAPS